MINKIDRTFACMYKLSDKYKQQYNILVPRVQSSNGVTQNYAKLRKITVITATVITLVIHFFGKEITLKI